jgi:hypothetical protein
MTLHLTDEQLGASHDGALSGAGKAAAERHLAACAECRARLAELASRDAEIAGALEHDPGEAYFASFADRVSARIAGAAPAAAPAARRGLAAWWGSPRRLAWAGAALSVIALSALVTTLAREHGPQELATQAVPPRALGAGSRADQALNAAPGAGAALKQETPAPPAAPAARAARPGASAAPRAFAPAPAPAQLAPRAVAQAPGSADHPAERVHEEAALKRQAGASLAAPQHVMEVRTLPNGEQEVVSRAPQFAPAPPVMLPNGLSKPAAAPMAARSPAPAPVPSPAADQAAGSPGALQGEVGAPAPATGLATCGKVRDTKGRPAARALVTVPATGATVTAGADGSFCIDLPAGGGVLSVLAVGYRPARVHVGAADAAAPVAITLTPADVLAPMAPGATRDSSRFRGGMTRTIARSLSLPRRAASDASAAALKAGTVDAWNVAAARWETVALFERADAGAEPGFHAAEARVNAWLVGRTDAREGAALRAAAQKATVQFLDHAAPGTARDIALGWRSVLER